MEKGKVGEYKLAWIEGNTAHSTMHNTLPEALKAAKTGAYKANWMIFKLESMHDGHYTWTILPHGSGTIVSVVSTWATVLFTAIVTTAALAYFTR